MISIRYASIRSMDISNGEGVGVALFVQGCHFHCPNCFNLETWDFNGGKEWTEEVKNKFLELTNRPYIKRISILGGEPLAEENLDDILDLVIEINKRYNQNVFQNAEMLLDRGISNALYSQNEYTEGSHDDCHRIRLSLPHKSIWLYTGYNWNHLMEYGSGVSDDFDYIEESYVDSLYEKRKQIVQKCDVIIDGQYMESQRDISLPYRGSKNQRLINVKESLGKGETVLWKC